LNLEDGISVQALLPSANILQSFSGLVASPANLQLKPMMAMGSFAQSLLVLPILALRDVLASFLVPSWEKTRVKTGTRNIKVDLLLMNALPGTSRAERLQ